MASRVPVRHPSGSGPHVRSAPSPAVTNVAVFRSGETMRLSRQLGFDVAVIAVTDRPDAYAARLSRDRYGVVRIHEGGAAPWDDRNAAPIAVMYERFDIDPRWMGGVAPPSGLSVVEGNVRVELAAGARPSEFAATFAAAMQDRAFESVARRPGQVAFRHRTGRPLDVTARYAGDLSRVSRPHVVDDLYAFSPRGMRSLVARIHQAATLVGVRSALRLASQSGVSRDA